MGRGIARYGSLLALVTIAMTAGVRAQPPGRAERDIRGVLEAQVAAWNLGDIDGFMEGYARSPSTRFASGGSVVYGWETVRDRYKIRYDTREKMGILTFTDLEISVLSRSSALAFGRWKVETAESTASGLFTLQFARSRAGWRVVADHTSAAEVAPRPH